MTNGIRKFSIAAIVAGVLSLSGCAGLNAGIDTVVNTANSKQNVMAAQIELGTYADIAENATKIQSLCMVIDANRAQTNAGWSFIKGAGGLALRTAGVVAAVAGVPFAGVLDLAGEAVGKSENFVGEIDRANAALLTSNDEKCAKYGVVDKAA